NTNIQDLSRNTRSYGGNIVGAWRTYTMNATLLYSEYFYDLASSNVTGTWPRVSLMRNEKPIGNSPAYFSVSSEFTRQLRNASTPAARRQRGGRRPSRARAPAEPGPPPPASRGSPPPRRSAIP